MEIAIDVARGMPRGEDDRTLKLCAVGCAHSHYPTAISGKEEGIDSSLEMHFPSGCFDLFAHSLDDAGQAVGADVGMGIGEDIGGGSVLAEDAEDALDVATLFGTRIEFSVRESSGSAFSKGVVALTVYDVIARDGCEVFFSCINIASALEDDGAYAEFYESECCEESSGACSYNDGLRGVGDVGIVDGIVGQGGGVLIDEDF